jgi:segregation and condensation protein B
MQNEPSDVTIDSALLHSEPSTDGVLTQEFRGGTAVLDIDLPGGPWTPPVQEAPLDAELVAILFGDVVGGDELHEQPAAHDGNLRETEGGESAEAQAAGSDAGAAPEPSVDAGDEGGGDEPLPEELVRATAALLLASPEALSVRRLADLLGGTKPKVAAAALSELGRRFEAAGLPFVVRELAGGWRLFTDPAMAEVVARLDASRKQEKISPAALETLAIVAYRQPVTKAEIEAIRGVQAGPILRTLVDRGLVKVAGRAEQPGAPLLYGTTQAFLDRFGLGSLADLPRDGELARD